MPPPPRSDETGPGAWTIGPLDPGPDAEAVRSVLLACTDYALLETGEPPGDTAVADFFDAAPPGRDPATVLKLGIFDADRSLVGLVDLAREYPDAGTWYLGLLLIVPAARGQGAGRRVLGQLEALATAAGARRMLLAALQSNRRALRFWRAAGFAFHRKTAPRTIGRKVHALVELVRDLDAPLPPAGPPGALDRFLDAEGRLKALPASPKDRRTALAHLAARFEPGRSYTERAVNDVLKAHHSFGDWVTLRRELVDAGLLRRTADGARYWRADPQAPDSVA